MKHFTIIPISLIFISLSFGQTPQDSAYIAYWNASVKKTEGVFRDAKKQGTWSSWNKKGAILSREVYDNGILIKQKEYNPKDEEIYLETTFYRNGVIKSNGNIILGDKDGKWTFYKNDGNIDMAKTYVNGREESEVKELESRIKVANKENKKLEKLKKGYEKGSYVDENGMQVNGYFKLMDYNRLSIKHSLKEKANRVIVSGINNLQFGGSKYVVLDSLHMIICSPLGRRTHNNVVARHLINGRISLYIVEINCSSVPGGGYGGGYGGVGNPIGISGGVEMLVIQKGMKSKPEHINLSNKKGREYFKLLVNDNKEFIAEIEEVKLKFADLRTLIPNYNSKGIYSSE